MSSQSMKYHELPSFEKLIAYQNGELSAVESLWIEELVQKNPMVKAVLESTSSINPVAVKNIAKRTSHSILSVYYTKYGFWSKYGMWIGLSSILLILGSTFLFQTLKPETLYEQTSLTLNETIEEPNYSKSPKEKAVIEGGGAVEDKKSSVFIVSEEDGDEKKQVNNPDLSDNLEDKSGKDLQILKLEKQTKTSFKEQVKKEKQVDNTRNFTTESSVSSKTMVLSVQQVQILAKVNPDDFSSVQKKDKKGNPLQVFGQKAGSKGSYSIDDMPKYPGGDVALQNYFAGKFHPIKVQEKDNRYDKSVMIDLEINFRGKLKDYKIYGELHPDHQKALIKAIEELPRFDKGTENITYSLGIVF